MTTDNQAKRTDVDKALLGSATYRSLGEQKLSPQEERFEKGRRTVGLVLAPLLTVVFLLLPIDIPRAVDQRGGAHPDRRPARGGHWRLPRRSDDVLGPFGSSTIFTFIGAFILAQAMLKHGVARRFAFRILSLPKVGGSTTQRLRVGSAIMLMLAYGASVGGLLTPSAAHPT